VSSACSRPLAVRLTVALRVLQEDPLHRKRELFRSIVRYWTTLLSISIVGSFACAPRRSRLRLWH
jgi:hypothetical protein